MSLRNSTLIVGGSLFVFAIVLNIVLPREAARMPQGFSTPILAFEFAQQPDEVLMMYNFDKQNRKEEFIDNMQKGNYLDYVYMLLYSAFLSMVIVFTSQRFSNKNIMALLTFSILAFVGDATENVFILLINRSIELNSDFTAYLSAMHIVTWIKWLALALAFAFIAWFWIKQVAFWRFVNAFMFVPLILGVFSWFYREEFTELFAFSLVIAFLLAFINMIFNRFDNLNIKPERRNLNTK